MQYYYPWTDQFSAWSEDLVGDDIQKQPIDLLGYINIFLVEFCNKSKSGCKHLWELVLCPVANEYFSFLDVHSESVNSSLGECTKQKYKFELTTLKRLPHQLVLAIPSRSWDHQRTRPSSASIFGSSLRNCVGRWGVQNQIQEWSF